MQGGDDKDVLDQDGDDPGGVVHGGWSSWSDTSCRSSCLYSMSGKFTKYFLDIHQTFPCQEACPEAPPASSCPPDPATIPDPGMEAETVRERISDFQLVIQFG